jgi:hypothetical protein
MGLRYAVATVAIGLAALFFLFSAEEGGVALIDWVRDPEDSRMRHDLHLAQRDAEARDLEEQLVPGSRASGRRRSGLAAEAEVDGLRGRALHLDGSPAIGVGLVAALPARGVATTDERGTFVLAGASTQAEVRLDGEGWILLGSGREASLRGDEELLLVVAERTSLGGIVIDEEGTPLEGAQVSVSTPLALGAADEIPIALPARLERDGRSDARGRFELTDVPQLPFLTVEIRKPGYEAFRGGAPAVPGEELEVVLRPEDG